MYKVKNHFHCNKNILYTEWVLEVLGVKKWKLVNFVFFLKAGLSIKSLILNT